MICSVNFGGFAFSIEYPECLMQSVSKILAEYIVDNVEKADRTLTIKLREMHLRKTFHEGWNVEDNGDVSLVSYVANNDVMYVLAFTQECKSIDIYISRASRKKLSLGIQFATLISLASECLGLHGVTLICNNQVIILSAPSGTGKTTLATLLHCFSDAAIINGDFALLYPNHQQGVVFIPTPFCGTSGTSFNYCLPVDKIVFLQQAHKNEWHRLSTRQALVHTMSNSFIPEWDDDLRQKAIDGILKLLQRVGIYQFSFEPTREASKLFLEMLNM